MAIARNQSRKTILSASEFIDFSFLAHSLPNSRRRVKARLFDGGQYLV